MMSRKNNVSLASSSVLYVGQIPYDWNETIIKSVVCGSGNVVDVRLGFDFAGKNKGFCFVEYQTPFDAQKAIGLLSQIKLLQVNPKGQYKKLRIELSKEGLRSNAAGDAKPILNLDRSQLPNYVQLPQEMVYNGPPLPPNNGKLTPSLPFTPINGGQQDYSFQQNQMPQHFQTQHQYQNQQNYHHATQTPPNIMPGQQPGQQAGQQVSSPAPQKLPFVTREKIDETLSQIPPAQLIDLITNLKGILNSPNSSRAVEVFRLSPNLAGAVAQALLLMGFIDSEVITESMKSVSDTTLPPKPQELPRQPALPQIPTPQNMANPYGQFPQQQMAPAPPSTKWPHLPPSAAAKLSAMAPDQAELIAQVLSLPADQISSLPPDKQAMVTSLRAQYL